MQSGLHRGTHFWQFDHWRVGVVELQFRVASAKDRQADIDDAKQDGDHQACGIAGQGLDPADAVVNRKGQRSHRNETEKHAHHPAQEGLGLATSRQAFHLRLLGFQMDDVDQRDIGNQCRYEGMGHHLEVGDADILDHQEGRRAHDRRHDLAINRRRHLDRTGLF